MSRLRHGDEATALPFSGSQESCSPQIRVPSIIARALSSLQCSPRCTTLGRSAKDVLAYLVRLANVDDACAPVFAFKRTVAVKAGVSESTVYRALLELTEVNIIIREPQRRKERNGRLGIAQLRLSAAFCTELGLPVVTHAAPAPAVAPSSAPQTPELESARRGGEGAETTAPPSVKMTDGQCITGFKALQSLQKHSSGLPTHMPVTQPQTPRTKVPEELLWLIAEKNLTQPQVFLLMRDFGRRQQRLSDAVEATHTRLRQLDEHALFRYLRALSKAPTDFAWMRKVRQATEQAEQRKRELREIGAELLTRLDGQYLASTDGTSVHQIDASTQTAEVWWREGTTGRIRNGRASINPAYLAAVDAGRLTPISSEGATRRRAQWSARPSAHEQVD